jgi:urease accessory protein
LTNPRVLERITTMKRASRIVHAADWCRADAIDRVVIDAEGRYRRRIVLTGERGTRFLLDLPQAVALRDGDGLVLDDGSVVCVFGKPEALVEVAAENAAAMARLAWHLGNRHTEVQIAGDRLRMRRDHVLEEMLLSLGARLTPVEAPFEPERGAYEHQHGEDSGSHV